jgi:hypothetical protein
LRSSPSDAHLVPSPSVLRSLVLALAALVLLACGGDDADPAPPQQGVEGEAGLCADIAALEQALERVLDLDSSSTLGEAKQARDDVDFALAELQEAESDVATRFVAQLQSSFTGFNAELDSLSSGRPTPAPDQPLGQNATTLTVRADGMLAAQAQIAQAAGCPN